MTIRSGGGCPDSPCRLSSPVSEEGAPSFAVTIAITSPSGLVDVDDDRFRRSGDCRARWCWTSTACEPSPPERADCRATYQAGPIGGDPDDVVTRSLGALLRDPPGVPVAIVAPSSSSEDQVDRVPTGDVEDERLALECRRGRAARSRPGFEVSGIAGQIVSAGREEDSLARWSHSSASSARIVPTSARRSPRTSRSNCARPNGDASSAHRTSRRSDSGPYPGAVEEELECGHFGAEKSPSTAYGRSGMLWSSSWPGPVPR